MMTVYKESVTLFISLGYGVYNYLDDKVTEERESLKI